MIAISTFRGHKKTTARVVFVIGGDGGSIRAIGAHPSGHRRVAPMLSRRVAARLEPRYAASPPAQ